MTEYDEEKVLTDYVWTYYWSLMTEFERNTERALYWQAMSRLNKWTVEKERSCQQHFGHKGDPAIMEILTDPETYRRRVCRQLIAERGEEVFINRCPKCGKIVRTPKARLCLWCGYSWHHKAR